MSFKRKTFDFSVRDSRVKKSKMQEIAKFFKTTSLIETNIKISMKKNSNEIKIVEIRYESNDSRTTNYLNCNDTKFLREFLDSARIYLNFWVSDRATHDKYLNFNVSKLFKWLNRIERSKNINSNQDLSQIEYADDEFYVMKWFTTMYRMLKNCSNFNFDTLIFVFDQMIWYNFTIENWHKTYCDLKYYWRFVFSSRNVVEIEKTSKKQKIEIETFLFFTKEQFNHYQNNFKTSLWKLTISNHENDEMFYKTNDVQKTRIQNIIKTNRFIQTCRRQILNVTWRININILRVITINSNANERNKIEIFERSKTIALNFRKRDWIASWNVWMKNIVWFIFKCSKTSRQSCLSFKKLTKWQKNF